MKNRHPRPPHRHEPWGAAGAQNATTGRLDAADPHVVRRKEQILRDLVRAGLDREQALAQLSRLEAGDVWSG
jgi:hypothetical protein